MRFGWLCLLFFIFSCSYFSTNKPSEQNANQAFSCGSFGATKTARLADNSYTLFESGLVTPLAWSDDGKKLFSLNIAANCLEIYGFNQQKLTPLAGVLVGLEPVALAVNNTEVWVVNQLSDSISIVETQGTPHIKQTLAIGDEPMDIVFAGKNPKKAFITTAHRGQNHPQFQVKDLFTPGQGRADIWVYDANNPGAGLTGAPLEILTLFTDSLRALAVSHDQQTLYAASFFSGNNTSVLDQATIQHHHQQKPRVNLTVEGKPQPDTGLIVKYDNLSQKWVDEKNQDWTSDVRFYLPDNDVFAINVNGKKSYVLERYSGVGTTLFNMAINPISGDIYVSNLEAINHIRFEGKRSTPDTLNGRFVENQITVISPSTQQEELQVKPVNLNPHLKQDLKLPNSKIKSLSQPTAMAVSPDGRILYVTMFGSGKLVAIPTEQLSKGEIKFEQLKFVDFDSQGPIGLALSPNGDYLAVYTRFNNGISMINADTMTLITQIQMFTPEPKEIQLGRPFLYDANLTSGNGAVSCSGCHIFAETDRLAWDLGNPDGEFIKNLNSYRFGGEPHTKEFHPLKGPMTTQTLKGLKHHGPMHWRGDRRGLHKQQVNQQKESLESAAFKEFNDVFEVLLDRDSPLVTDDMQNLTHFSLALTPSPNPIKALDGSLTPEQQAGKKVFFDDITIPFLGNDGQCVDCHHIAPKKGKFGTTGQMFSENLDVSQDMKIPSLRESYKKLGMFGTAARLDGDHFTGAQVKGFGLLHDGSIDTISNFLRFGIPFETTDEQKKLVRHFVMVFDSNLDPIVGQQVTLHKDSSQAEVERWQLLEQGAKITEPLAVCDLIFSGIDQQGSISGIYIKGQGYQLYQGGMLSGAELDALRQKPNNFVTFTCVPPKNGARIALNE